MLEFRRFLQLYTLHQIEHEGHLHKEVLHIRLSIVRYALKQLPANLNQQWQLEPTAGVEQARNIIVTRLARLMEDDGLQQQMVEHNWEPYHQARSNQVVPALPPARVLAPSRAKSVWERRIDQTERLLYLAKTAFEVANAGLVLWRNWRAMRQERPMIVEALRSTIQSQEKALQHGSASDFVRAYLTEHNDDPAHSIVFADESDD